MKTEFLKFYGRVLYLSSKLKKKFKVNVKITALFITTGKLDVSSFKFSDSIEFKVIQSDNLDSVFDLKEY